MKLFEIIKSRWPEVVVVVVIQACCMFLFKDIGLINTRPEEYSGRTLLLGIGLAAFSIVGQMMLWGFLRTTAVTGMTPIQPGMLLSIGRWYFWKLFLVQVALSFVLILIASVVQMFFSSILYHKPIPENIPVWLEIIPMLIGGIVLIKPIYFIPAAILVGNLGAMEAFRYLRQLDLFRMGRFLPLAIGVTLLTGGLEFLSVWVHRTDALYYPVTILQAIIISAGLLIISLAAVVEVCNLRPKPVEDDSQDEQVSAE